MLWIVAHMPESQAPCKTGVKDESRCPNQQVRKKGQHVRIMRSRSIQCRRRSLASTIRYMLMMSYISPLATACCMVATPSLRLAFSV